jgi:hypothetical protein
MNFDSNRLQPISHLWHDKEAVELPAAVLVLLLLCTNYCYLYMKKLSMLLQQHQAKDQSFDVV